MVSVSKSISGMRHVFHLREILWEQTEAHFIFTLEIQWPDD